MAWRGHDFLNSRPFHLGKEETVVTLGVGVGLNGSPRVQQPGFSEKGLGRGWSREKLELEALLLPLLGMRKARKDRTEKGRRERERLWGSANFSFPLLTAKTLLTSWNRGFR